MTDAAVDEFISNVDPTAREFLNDYGSERRGRAAAVTLAHFGEHYFHFCPGDRGGATNSSQFVNHLASTDAEFAFLLDVANASKHRDLTKTPRGRVLSIQSLTQIEATTLGWGEASWGEGRWGGPKQVWVSLDSGQTRALDAAVKRVHAMWASKLGLTLPPLE